MKQLKIKILLIEDDEEDFILFKNLLKRAETPHDLYWEISAEKGLEKLKHAKIDIAFIDYKLGAQTGLYVLRELKRIRTAVPVIMLTGLKDSELDKKLISFGADDYLIKGELTAGILNRSIRYAIERSKMYQKQQRLVEEQSRRRELENKKDEFINIASHELKTPLTTLKAYAQIMSRSIQNNDISKLNIYSQRMNKQLDILQDYVNDLLDVNKIQAGKLVIRKQDFDIYNMMEEINDQMQEILPEYKLSITPIHQIITADKERIEQVLVNIITNAAKYSSRSKEINVKIQKNNHDIEISVQDFGIGIPKNKQLKIFDRFFQVDKVKGINTGGLGLGLYISKSIIDQHNGKIWVKSVEGKGSTFYFTIPLN